TPPLVVAEMQVPRHSRRFTGTHVSIKPCELSPASNQIALHASSGKPSAICFAATATLTVSGPEAPRGYNCLEPTRVHAGSHPQPQEHSNREQRPEGARLGLP